MSGNFNLDDYVDVSERIDKFYERYPEGSLQGEWQIVEVGGETFVVYDADAYRGPDDQRPSRGTAWEPFPGKTPYTRQSELMNAQTSAWGRAIAALGFEVKRGIASRQEVANRQNGGEASDNLATANQKRACTNALNKAGVAKELQRSIVHALAGDPPTKAGMSKILDLLFDKDSQLTPEQRVEKLVEMADAVPPSDVPADTSDLPEYTEEELASAEPIT